MKIVDLNLLLYAVNEESVRHAEARSWLEAALSGKGAVGLAWVVVLGFLRLTTSGRVFPKPIAPEAATLIVDGWLDRPTVVLLTPGTEHWRILRALIAETGTAGNLTTDAHLAALAIENGAELHSTDADFARYRGLRWVNPLAEP